MSTTTRYQDGCCRWSNLLFSSVMLLSSTILSTSAQLNSTRSLNDVTYAEIHKLMPQCHPKDTCSVAREDDDAVNHYCHCNSYCTMFGTCCVDSQYRNVVPPKLTPHSCVKVYNNGSRRVYMIDKCRQNWTDDYVQERCLGDGDERSDPLLIIPVTNNKSGITYKNYFCAACNGEDKGRGDIVFWQMGVFVHREINDTLSRSPITESELKRLRYRDRRWEVPGSTDMRRVWFELDIPSSLTRHVKFCRDEVISTCLEDWTGEVTRARCASYMAIVASNYMLFRNLHCALCNRELLDKLQCRVPYDSYPPPRTPFNMGFLVDINRADGDIPGLRRRCQKKQIFNPVQLTCVRTAGCLGGRVARNGQCHEPDSGSGT